ncbi:YceI family protein [Gordonia aichiensis]|uniref:YceI family protein n=1 Tax=Gordonia aichiensis TaxID=36820 RepID=UPI00326778E4
MSPQQSGPHRIEFGPDRGTLTVRTDVTGRAARTGHRLVLGFDRWRATVSFDDGVPTRVDLTVEVESMQVLSGEGGLTPMTLPERLVARGNALKSLKSGKFGEIGFAADEITATDDGYELTGQLTICGTPRPHTVRVCVTGDDGRTQLAGESTVRQTDFGVKQYSLMMGALKVADEVVVELAATVGDT